LEKEKKTYKSSY